MSRFVFGDWLLAVSLEMFWVFKNDSLAISFYG